MKKLLKILGILAGLLVVFLISAYFYINSKYPDVGPAPDMKIISTPEMIERGKYLSVGFASCIDCHSQRDYSKFSGPVIPGTEGMGGENFGEGAGTVLAKNITSDKETGLGNWTDGEIFRAITMGVDKDGEPLGPMMPYMYFRNMDEEDIKAIIAYIRTLPPIKNEIPKHDLKFPVSLIFRTLPLKPDFKKLPDKSNIVALGQYYSGGCMFCHSPMEKGEFIKDKEFSGGNVFPNPKGGIIRSVNITPDKETGIGNWTKEQFIQKFRSYSTPEAQNIHVKDGEFNSIMPWTFYNVCTDEDLGAVYDYLMTQKPVKNLVQRFDPTGIPPY
ncbi:MAG TPA: cytochrome c [Ignavibacteria bacterium]|nr:cytochrome C [Bacteroidota bacterium]HRI84403.1 cytochrome c [Ignavibacteria bacterium]HRJ98381.1 cytochrome c [Ignavibacteria bacterium]